VPVADDAATGGFVFGVGQGNASADSIPGNTVATRSAQRNERRELLSILVNPFNDFHLMTMSEPAKKLRLSSKLNQKPTANPNRYYAIEHLC
jgi:hypothetical protein